MFSLFHNDCEAIEEAFVAQWAIFGRAPGGSYHEDGELTWTEAPVSQLPYNAIIRTRFTGNADDRIDGMLRHFQTRGAQFLWVVHPLSHPADLEERLKDLGLLLAGREMGMCLHLTGWKMPEIRSHGPISYKEMNNEKTLNDYEHLIEEYWGLPGETHDYVDGYARWVYQSIDQGVGLLAYMQDEPVGKAYLSLKGPDNTASVWGVYVKPAARGYGVATGLTVQAIRYAADLGNNRVVLASSEMGLNIYRRIGFKETCVIPIYANATLPAALQGLQPV